MRHFGTDEKSSLNSACIVGSWQRSFYTNISFRIQEDDKVDARTLARLVRADPELLYPSRHRGVEARHDLVLLRARDALVGNFGTMISIRARFRRIIRRAYFL
jgi:hypothetical protein